MLEDRDGGGRGAPWCCWVQGCGVGEVGKGLEAGAADYCDLDWVCMKVVSVALVVMLQTRKSGTRVGVCDVGHPAEANMYTTSVNSEESR